MPLISTAQTLTGSFADLGTVIVTGDYDLAALWLNLDINSSLDVQIKVLGSDTEDFAVSYDLPILDISDAALVGVAPQIFAISNNVDQKIIVPMMLSDAVPFIKFQVKAGTVGAPAGSILTAKVSAKTTGRFK